MRRLSLLLCVLVACSAEPTRPITTVPVSTTTVPTTTTTAAPTTTSSPFLVGGLDTLRDDTHADAFGRREPIFVQYPKESSMESFEPPTKERWSARG